MHRAEPRILAVTNQKGGVGKSTTAINLGAAYAAMGHHVLIIDLDPQGNASTGLGVAQKDRTPSTYDILVGSAKLADAVRPTTAERLTIVPATSDLSSIDLELSAVAGRTRKLKSALQDLRELEVDLVLMDCPPSLNLLTLNAMVAAHGVIIPLQCEFFALEGISQLLRSIGEIRNSLNTQLVTQGIVLTMYDSRNNLTLDVENDVRSTLGDLVCKTVIPRNVRLSEAPSYGRPARDYDLQSAGAQAYERLARELHSRVLPGHALQQGKVSANGTVN